MERSRRLLAIGDIHGHLNALDALLNVVRPSPGDQIVFLGDYVDKGPDVKGVINRLIKFGESHNAVFLRGNHDQMLIDAHHDPDKVAIVETLAGKDALASYGNGDLRSTLDRVPANHWKFLGETRDYFETPDYIFVHGGIRAGIDPANEEQERLFWTTLSLAAPHYSGRTVICGHTSQRSGEIVDLGHTICIDTGITRNQWLTCLDVGALTFSQASAEGVVRLGVLRKT